MPHFGRSQKFGQRRCQRKFIWWTKIDFRLLGKSCFFSFFVQRTHMNDIQKEPKAAGETKPAGRRGAPNTDSSESSSFEVATGSARPARPTISRRRETSKMSIPLPTLAPLTKSVFHIDPVTLDSPLSPDGVTRSLPQSPINTNILLRNQPSSRMASSDTTGPHNSSLHRGYFDPMTFAANDARLQQLHHQHQKDLLYAQDVGYNDMFNFVRQIPLFVFWNRFTDFNFRSNIRIHPWVRDSLNQFTHRRQKILYRVHLFKAATIKPTKWPRPSTTKRSTVPTFRPCQTLFPTLSTLIHRCTISCGRNKFTLALLEIIDRPLVLCISLRPGPFSFFLSSPIRVYTSLFLAVHHGLKSVYLYLPCKLFSHLSHSTVKNTCESSGKVNFALSIIIQRFR